MLESKLLKNYFITKQKIKFIFFFFSFLLGLRRSVNTLYKPKSKVARDPAGPFLRAPMVVVSFLFSSGRWTVLSNVITSGSRFFPSSLCLSKSKKLYADFRCGGGTYCLLTLPNSYISSDFKIGSHADDDLNSVLKVLY